MPSTQSVTELLEKWGNTTFSEKEVPLTEVVESLKGNSERFTLKKSKQYSSHWLVSNGLIGGALGDIRLTDNESFGIMTWTTSPL